MKLDFVVVLADHSIGCTKLAIVPLSLFAAISHLPIRMQTHYLRNFEMEEVQEIASLVAITTICLEAN